MDAFLDATEIALTVLYPNEGLNIGLQRDRDWAVGLARAYNDWLHHDFLSVSPRFQGVALLAPQEPQEAAKELKRAVRERDMVAGMLPGVMSPMKGLGLPEFDPIYAMAEKLDIPVAVQSPRLLQVAPEHFGKPLGLVDFPHGRILVLRLEVPERFGHPGGHGPRPGLVGLVHGPGSRRHGQGPCLQHAAQERSPTRGVRASDVAHLARVRGAR